VAESSAADYLPPSGDLDTLAAAAQGCRGCDLHLAADNVVFGTGPATARMLLIGEQPGDQEDRRAQPFVGPAGRLLDRALADAGIDRAQVYLTNAVKHFKFTRAESGGRRIHKTPSRTEVVACRPWMVAELGAIRPDVVVLLGATAAKALLGNDFRVTAHRGEVLRLPPEVVDADPAVVATVHPSSVLRGPPEARDEALQGLVRDLRTAADLLPE
jgi:uracil-DNA glycosylase